MKPPECYVTTCTCCDRSTEIKNGGADTFFLHQPEESLNFPPNLAETKLPFDEDVFRFGAEDEEAEGEYCPLTAGSNIYFQNFEFTFLCLISGFNDRNPKSKISLTDESSVISSAPQ